MKVFALAALAATTLLCSDARADGRNAGSLLVYPLQRSDAGFSIISVANSAVTPATPQSLGDSTNLHFHYVNVQSHPWLPTRARECTVFDRIEFLTPADTLSVLANCHNPGGSFGTKGYVVVVAEDPTQSSTPWSHNHLIGSAMVGLATGVVYQYNAFAVEALVAPKTPCDVSPINQVCDFNGIEYEQLPNELIVDSFTTLFPQSLALVNFTGRTQDINQIYMAVWNDNEYPLSLTLDMNCWFHRRLDEISTLFTQSFMRLVTNDPAEMDCTCDGVGDVETGWITISSVGVHTSGGLPVASDGALLGVITSGPTMGMGARLLWERGVQSNGSFDMFGPN